MKTPLILLILALSIRGQAQNAPSLRAAAFDASELPKVVVPLDVKRVQSGIPVLHADDFSLLEDASKTSSADHILEFRDTGMDLALIVVIDASPSMRGRPLEAIRKGLAQLVSRKRSKDQVAIMSFADDTRWETRWNSSAEATQDAFTALQTRGDRTRLYDAVEEAIGEFGRQEKDSTFPLRRCILLISDGHDEDSHTTSSQLSHDLKASGIRLDAVGLAHSPVWLGSLRQVAQAGFGEFFTAATPEDLTNFLSQGIDSLLDMPALEFKTQNLTADGKIHQLGITYAPTGLRQQMELQLPEPVWRTRRVLYLAGAGLGVLVLIILLLAWIRSPKPVTARTAAPPHSATPVVATQPAPPAAATMRAPTVVESVSRSQPSRVAAASMGSPLTVAQTSARTSARSTAALSDAPAKLSLKSISGPYAGQIFQIDQPEFWIGSASNNHLCLESDQGVSGNHLCIRHEQPFYRIYDNGSMNNTFVNGVPISQQVTAIRPGDQLRVGATEFQVEASGDA